MGERKRGIEKGRRVGVLRKERWDKRSREKSKERERDGHVVGEGPVIFRSALQEPMVAGLSS